MRLRFTSGSVTPSKSRRKVVGGVHVQQVQVVMVPEEVQDFFGLIFAQQAVVHEDAGEAVADGPVHQDGGDGRVHPAGEGADDPPVAHLLPDILSGGLDEGLHGPQGRQLTDAEEKVAEDHLAPGGVVHLGMKLHPVELPGPVGHRPGRTGVAGADDLKARGDLFHLVAVAHPDLFLRVEAEKQVCGVFDAEGLVAVFPGGGRDHLASQQVVHQLDAVADAQNRHPQRRRPPGRCWGRRPRRRSGGRRRE